MVYLKKICEFTVRSERTGLLAVADISCSEWLSCETRY